MNQENRIERFGILGHATLIWFVAMTLGCSASSNPPAKAAVPGPGVVDIEKSKCETAGPMQPEADADGQIEIAHIEPRTDHFCALMVPIDANSLKLLAAGSKLYDYRRSHPTDRISHVVFFNNLTLEISAIAEVVETIVGNPKDLTKLTYKYSGTNYESVYQYFNGRDYGFAIELRNFQALMKPISLADARALDPKFSRPYGYLFLDRHPVIESEIQRRSRQMHAIATPKSPPV